MSERASKLFVGVGNVLRHDDGVGVITAGMLANLALPPDVEVCDAGTIGPDAAVLLARRRLVVVADAIDAGAEPGTIFRLPPVQLRPAVASGLSVHDLHLLDALEQARLLGEAPQRVVIYAVQTADVSLGLGLSPAVSGALPRLLDSVLRELGVSDFRGDRAGALGELRPRASAEVCHATDKA